MAHRTSPEESSASGPGRRRRAVLVAGVLAPLTVFAFLALAVAARAPGLVDRTVFAHLYSGESDWPLGETPGRDNPVLEVVMPQLERLNDDREIVALVVLVLAATLLAGRLRAAAFFAGAVAIGLFSTVFKSAFARDSPFPLPGQNSFPSGHGLVAMAIAAAAVVLLAGTRWHVPAMVVGALFVAGVGAAVIADAGHWLSDVVAGWCLAVAWVSTLWIVVSLRAGDVPVGAYLRERRRWLARRSAPG